MKITITQFTKHISALGFLALISFSCQASGQGYLGYHAGVLTVESYSKNKSAIMNNIKFGYLEDSSTPLRLGAEATLSFSPDIEIDGGKYSQSGFDILGVADYSFSKNWHANVKGGLGIEKTEYSNEFFYAATVKTELKEIYPKIGLGISRNLTKSVDLGIMMHYNFKHDSSRTQSMYGTAGINYYFG